MTFERAKQLIQQDPLGTATTSWEKARAYKALVEKVDSLSQELEKLKSQCHSHRHQGAGLPQAGFGQEYDEEYRKQGLD